MCPSWQCPSRSTCRRNEASGTRPSHWQAWSNFDERRGVADRCESYWPAALGSLGVGARPAGDGEGGNGGGAGDGEHF